MNFKNFDLCLVPFRVNKLIHSQTIWTNKNSSGFLHESILEPENFRNKFSYISPGLSSLAGALDPNDSKTYFAERYGGIGVGKNGGGSRTGNVESFQIKGVGPNPLAGKNNDPWYSYGGFNLSDAVAEVIMGAVLDRLLPLGVVKNHGLIATGPTGAYDIHFSASPQPSWGALLVRSINLRPAHFLRAADFTPQQKLTRDSIRVKSMILQLRDELGGDTEFVSYVLNFLEKSAKQFAFAAAFRIAHGSMSVSNLCFDGQWIDLTNCSFLDGGKNRGYIVPFYSEHILPIEAGFNLFYIYQKVTSLKMDFLPLKRFYLNEFNKNLTQYTLQVLGLDEIHTSENDKSNELSEVSGCLQRLIFANKNFVDSWPRELPQFEPISALISSSYLSLVGLDGGQDQESLERVFTRLGMSLSRFHELFKCLYFQRFSQSKYDIVYLAIRALKLNLLSSFYYKGRIIKSFHGISRGNDIFKAKAYVDYATSFHKWAFDLKFADSLYLFRDQTSYIKYERNTCSYEMGEFGVLRSVKFANYEALMSSLDNSPCQLDVYGYELSKVLHRIGMTVDRIEKKLDFSEGGHECI